MIFLSDLLTNHYGITPQEISALHGYESSNWRVVDDKGNKWVLKAFPEDEYGFLRAENTVLKQLESKMSGTFPQVIPNLQKESLTKFNGQLFRLQTWIEGAHLAEVPHSPALLRSLGTLLGKLDRILSEVHHPVLSARRIYWDLENHYFNPRYLDFLTNPQQRKWVEYFHLQYQDRVLPQLSLLRRGVIHGDANDWNVFVQNDQVTGLIDFGDMVESPLIHELAIALTYVMFDKEDPLEAAVPVIEAYHAEYPLEPLEVELLFNLVAARLCASVSRSSYQKTVSPHNTYQAVSEKGAWGLLEKWVRLNPIKATNWFKAALGMPVIHWPGPDKDLQRRNRHLSTALSITFPEPIKMIGSAFQYMFDASGKSYLDVYNNIPHVGHCHPKVVEAGRKQMAQLNTNTRYLYDSLNEYAEQLLALFPPSLNKVFFVNSGSEANDLALRMARQHTGLTGIMVMEHGYHGHTRQTLEISHYKFAGKGGSGAASNILVAPIPDLYRSGFAPKDPYAGKKFAQKAMDLVIMEGRPPGVFISEPVVGCGGQVPLAPGYLQALYPFIREQGGVCISDEVQTGFGRLGEVLWGYELQGVIPDMVVLGKPMGNGHPMGAVICTEAIARSFENGMEFFSSFGGNPVSCEIGLAVLEVIREEGLQAHANEVGSYLKNQLSGLMDAFEVIGDVRGHGLFLGVELVKDRDSKEPFTALAKQVKNRLKSEFQIMVGTDGLYDQVLKIKPPLCFEKRDADRLVTGLELILQTGKY